MSFKYKYLDDVALADIAFEVEADSWQELLVGAAAATTAVMVNPATLRPSATHVLDLAADSLEELLYDWLAEIVYLKDTHGLFVAACDMSGRQSDRWRVHASLLCDPIDRQRHEFGQDVKAVTYHLFELTEEKGKLHARVVLDI